MTENEKDVELATARNLLKLTVDTLECAEETLDMHDLVCLQVKTFLPQIKASMRKDISQDAHNHLVGIKIQGEKDPDTYTRGVKAGFNLRGSEAMVLSDSVIRELQAYDRQQIAMLNRYSTLVSEIGMLVSEGKYLDIEGELHRANLEIKNIKKKPLKDFA